MGNSYGSSSGHRGTRARDHELQEPGLFCRSQRESSLAKRHHCFSGNQRREGDLRVKIVQTIQLTLKQLRKQIARIRRAQCLLRKRIHQLSKQQSRPLRVHLKELIEHLRELLKAVRVQNEIELSSQRF